MNEETRHPPAKINLTLRVGATRPDGFHEIESLVTQVRLCDTLIVAARESGRWALDCDDSTLPVDGSNLVLRAARALVEYTRANHGLDITLQKRIPAGAGLGGGSSDAASTLVALNGLWNLGLGRDELVKVAATLGSDVPLFLHGPLCVLRGRGEHVDEITRPFNAWGVLVLPALHCATPAVYAAFDRLPRHPQRPALADILAALGDVPRLMALLYNDLEEAAFAVEPELRGLAQRITEAGGQRVCLTGSGAAMFRLFAGEGDAQAFAQRITGHTGVRTVVVRTGA